MKIPRSCLDCGRRTLPGKSRCAEHERIVRKKWDRGSAFNRRARLASGDRAAARLRRRVNREGGCSCGSCGHFYGSHLVRVDHRLPLSSGGQDTEDNVQVLCIGCHHLKTVAEARERASR